MKALFLGCLLVLVAIIASLALFNLGTRKTIYLTIDGLQQEFTTRARTVRELLNEQDVTLQPGDRVFPGELESLGEGSQVVVERASPIRIVADGVLYPVQRTQGSLKAILEEAGIALRTGDQLLLAGKILKLDQPLPQSQAAILQVKRAVHIHLDTGEESISLYSTASTLGGALKTAGIFVRQADKVSLPLETHLQPETEPELYVSIRKAQSITIRFAGGSAALRSSAATVGEALVEAGMPLQGLDTSQPIPGSPLPENGEIRIVHVEEKVVVEGEPVPFETVMQPAPEVELDGRTVLQNGEYGIQARRIRIRYEDGSAVSEVVESEWLAQPPVNRVIGYGTKIVVRTVDTPDGPLEYWRAVRMYATSYSPCRIFDDRCDDSTALGAKLQKGVVAMTNYWCRYTCTDRVYVPGYGIGTVLDTGGGIPGRYWIDLGYSDDDYVSWHHWVTVYFLTPVPSNLMWVLP